MTTPITSPALGEASGSPDEGVFVPPLRFVAPDGFHALPVTDSPEERAAGIAEFVRELFPKGNEELWTGSATQFTDLAEMMSDTGHAYSAIGLFGIEEGIAHCTLDVAAIESDHTDPEIAAQGIRVILANEPDGDVRWLDLPCGPAVSRIFVQELIPARRDKETGDEPKGLLMGRIQVHIPFPTGPFTAVVTLGTTAMDHWDEVCDMMAAILRTVSFPDPSEEQR